MDQSLPAGAELFSTYSTPNYRRIDRVQYGEKTYKLSTGLWFPEATPDAVVDVIATAYRTRVRLRFYSGDQATGKDWGCRWDVAGTVGRSMGPVKIPLLIASNRSIGGGAISCDSLVKIRENAGAKRVLYQHPHYTPGSYAVGPNNRPESVERGYPLAVYRDGEQVYGCRTPAEGAKEITFLTT